MDRITWINHAGFRLESGDIRLICDPWLTGSAFDKGWSLLSPTKMTPAEVGQATHIWISHEHPDHFSPRDLRSLPARPTVLFQKTRDGRVVRELRKWGFPVVELEPMRPFDIGGVELTTASSNLDSWLHVRTPQATYLNMNDLIPRQEDWTQLRRVVGGSLDVLLTQFSYASWVHDMKAAADEKRAEMRRQIKAFQPKHLIPFASFVYFSHEENFWLNEGANTIDAIEREFQSVVLYPGDVWDVGAVHDNAAALARYAADAAARSVQATGRPVSIDRLQQTARRTWWPFPVTIRFSDRGDVWRFRFGRLSPTKEAADISCTVEAFLACLTPNMGQGTLSVNGRFQEERPGGAARFSRAFALDRLGLQGYSGPQALMRLVARRL